MFSVGMGGIGLAGLSPQALPGALGAFFSRDPDVTFNFIVQVDYVPIGEFVGVDGIGITNERHQHRGLGMNDTPAHLVGGRTVTDITLKWGLMNRSDLWDWADAAKVGGAFRKTVTITQVTRGHIPLRIYNLSNCMPLEFRGAPLDSNQNGYAVEELKLSADSLSTIAVPLPF